MAENNLLSASPLCPRTQQAWANGDPVEYGYSNGHHLSGWCIMTNRKLYDIIGAINDEFPFWFADNVYAEQLKRYGVRHALVKTSWVDHKGGKTLRTVMNPDALTMAYIKLFIDRYPENESAIYFSKQLN